MLSAGEVHIRGRLGNGVMAGGANYFPLDVLAANGGSGNLSDIVKLLVETNTIAP